tara:strand:+ start:671 stop:835 length:165 start_codon:yes stop_codon:yes gene_type:complete
MASGSQIWSPIWADFPKLPKNIKNVITHNRSISLKNKNEKELSVEKLASEKIIE